MKKLLAILVSAVMMLSVPVSAAEPIMAQNTDIGVGLDAIMEYVSLEAYNINDNNYVKLRDIAQAYTDVTGYSDEVFAGFDITWDETTKAVNIITDQRYTPVGGERGYGDGQIREAVLSNANFMIDGNPVEFTAYEIAGNNYIKLRDLFKELNYSVVYDEEMDCIFIDSHKPYAE